MQNIKSSDGIINSVGKALTLGLNTGFGKNDGRSFWQKTGDTIDAGLNITFNALRLGSSVLYTTANLADQTSMISL